MKSGKTAKTTSATPDTARGARARRFLYWAILAQWIGIVVFYGGLLIGERSRITLYALYVPRQPLIVVALLALALAPLTRRRVRLLVGGQIVAVLFVLFPVMGLSLGHARSADHRIRLASYNIYFGKLSRASLLAEITAMDADVVLLQATYDSSERVIKERFADRYTNRTDDFVLLSRFKILKVMEPPPLPDGEQPKFVGYLLDTPSGPLRVYNVHPFSPRHALFGDKDADLNLAHREAQFEAAMLAARSKASPFVVVGDTNLPPGSAIARAHRGPLKDAFEEVGFGFGYTFPAKRPWMRIDRAFAGDDVRFLDFRVGDKGASDHRPIFVDFEIVAPPP